MLLAPLYMFSCNFYDTFEVAAITYKQLILTKIFDQECNFLLPLVEYSVKTKITYAIFLQVKISITQSRFIDKIKETMRSWLTEKQVEVTEIVNRVEQRKIAAERSSQTGRNVSANLASETDTWKEDLQTRKQRLEEKKGGKDGDVAACESNCPEGSVKNI